MKRDALDTAFSLFIRLRDADSSGYIRCVSCGKMIHWRSAQCAHYISRKHKATRWDDTNCAAACIACNYYNVNKHIQIFGEHLNKKFGPGYTDKLLLRSRATSKIGDFEKKELTKYFRLKASEIAKQKSIQL